MRNTFADTFYELGKLDERLALVVADISPAGSISKFREEFPDRFINTGVAEQIMIGICAGMALNGLRPFAYTIATFALYRTFEFVRDDLCYQNLPVTVVGIGGGVTYSTLGSTHHAQEDVAIATAIPNFQVVAPCDPYETEQVTKYLATQNEKPTYLRLGKAGEPDLSTQTSDVFLFGKIRYLRQGKEVCIFGYGPILKMANEVADEIEKLGMSVSVVSVHCIKPLDMEGVIEALDAHKLNIVIEEMVPHGGLASRLKEIAFDKKIKSGLECFTLKDEFMHVYGDHHYLQKDHGLTTDKILSKLNAIKIT